MVKVGFDDSGREAFLAGNERAFKRSSDRIAASERQARRGSAFSGGQNAAYRTGMISQQAQDVAVSLQMGMSASRVIAQQGSQIASIFGPKGMIIGGVIAIGAAIWEMASATAQAEKKAEALQKQWEKINSLEKEAVALESEARQSRVTRERGGFAGEIEGQNAEYQRKLVDNIERQNAVNRKKAEDINKEATGGGWRDLAQTVPILAQNVDDSATANAKKRKEIADAAGEEIAAIKRVMDAEKSVALEKLATFEIDKMIASNESIQASRAAAVMSDARAQEATEKDREYSEDLQREIDFITDRNKIRDSNHSEDQKNREYAALSDARAAKDDEVAATRKRKRDEDAAAVYLKSAEEQVKMTADKAKAEKDTAQFRDTSVQKYIRTQSELAALEKDYGMGGLERETKISEKKLELRKQEEGAIREIESMQREGAEFAKAGLSGSDSQNKRKAIEMEIDLLNKKKAFSPIEAQQIANKIELLRREQVSENFNMGALGAGGMGAFNRNRKAEERAQDRAEQRALGNMGLIDIVRGAGNSVVSGVDPVTGRRLSGKELEARKADMAAEKARRDMERKAAAGDKEAQERLKRVRWGNEQNGNDGKIAAGFSADQIKFLSTSIADAVKELITK